MKEIGDLEQKCIGIISNTSLSGPAKNNNVHEVNGTLFSTQGEVMLTTSASSKGTIFGFPIEEKCLGFEQILTQRNGDDAK